MIGNIHELTCGIYGDPKRPRTCGAAASRREHACCGIHCVYRDGGATGVDCVCKFRDSLGGQSDSSGQKQWQRHRTAPGVRRQACRGKIALRKTEDRDHSRAEQAFHPEKMNWRRDYVNAAGVKCVWERVRSYLDAISSAYSRLDSIFVNMCRRVWRSLPVSPE